VCVCKRRVCRPPGGEKELRQRLESVRANHSDADGWGCIGRQFEHNCHAPLTAFNYKATSYALCLLRFACVVSACAPWRGGAHAFGANEEPQPHEDSDCGLLRTWNEDEIISSTKSIVEPRTRSSDVSSITSLAPAFSNSTSSS
jgi:hypothetical protein